MIKFLPLSGRVFDRTTSDVICYSADNGKTRIVDKLKERKSSGRSRIGAAPFRCELIVILRRILCRAINIYQSVYYLSVLLHRLLCPCMPIQLGSFAVTVMSRLISSGS
jgi:hypothetical protein